MKDDRMVDTRDVIGRTITLPEKKEPMNEMIKKLDEEFLPFEFEGWLWDDLKAKLHARDTALVKAIAEAVGEELKRAERTGSMKYKGLYKAVEIIRSFLTTEVTNAEKKV